MTERQKQVRRIKQAIRRQNKKGYAISYTDLVGDSTTLNDLKNITPKVIRERAEYKVDISTGEIEYENPNFYTVDMQSDFIISQFRENVSKYFPAKKDVNNPADYINNWLDEFIHNEGKENTANLLTQAKVQGLWVSPEEFYHMGSSYSFIYQLETLYEEIDYSNFNGQVWGEEFYD